MIKLQDLSILANLKYQYSPVETNMHLDCGQGALIRHVIKPNFNETCSGNYDSLYEVSLYTIYCLLKLC